MDGTIKIVKRNIKTYFIMVSTPDLAQALGHTNPEPSFV